MNNCGAPFGVDFKKAQTENVLFKSIAVGDTSIVNYQLSFVN